MLNCSKQTILSLLQQLEDVCIGQLEKSKDKDGKQSVYCLRRPRETSQLTFSPEAVSQLAMCHNFLSHVLPEDLRKNLENTVLQAAKLVPEGIDPIINSTLGCSLFKGRIDYSPFNEQLKALIKAITENLVCSVRYRANWDGQEKEYDFAPKQLTVFHEAIYADGWKVSETGKALNEHHNTLAVHRLLKVEFTGRNSKSLPAIAPDSGSFGLIEGEVFEAKIKFSPKAASYIAEREWSQGEKKTANADGSLTLTMKAKSEDELVAWVLSFGDLARILSPKWLRESLLEKVSSLLAGYGIQLEKPAEIDGEETVSDSE
jgi:predicted DNA-binding transcriptional regulator YafY